MESVIVLLGVGLMDGVSQSRSNADVSEMGGKEFKDRLLSSRQIKNEMYFFEQMLENI